MAYEDTYDYEGQADLIAQQAAKIKALRAMQPIETPGQQPGFRSAVTGAEMIGPYVKRPLLGSLAPALADYTATQQEGQMNAAKSALTKTQYDNAAKWITAKPGNIADAVPDTQVPIQQGDTEPMGSFTGNPLKAIAGMTDPVEQQRAMEAYNNQLKGNMKTVPGTAAIPATRQSLLEWAAGGQANPATRQLALDSLKDQIVTQPGKESDRIYEAAQKALDRGATVEAARLKAIADRVTHMETNQTTLNAAAIRAGKESPGANATFHETATPDPNDPTKVIWQNANGQTTSMLPSKPAKDPLKNLPAAQSKAVIGNNTSMGKIDDALDMINTPAGAEATGLGKGLALKIPGIGSWVVNNWWDPNGTATRAMVQDIGSLKLHDRSGASVTVGEMPRLAEFIPSVGDSKEVATKKLNNLRREIELNNSEIRDYADSQGYRPGPEYVHRPRTTAEPAPTQTGPLTAPVTPSVNTPTVAPTSTPAPTQTVNGKSSLDINREAYNKAKNVYASRPTDANRNARDLARSDLERALNAVGSTEGEGIPEAVAQANAELGPTNFPRATAKRAASKTTSQKAEELLAKYK